MKAALIFLHKWLGVALALLFLMWFVSGVVLYCVPFPNLTQAERLAALPPLQLPGDCCLTAQEAAQRAGLRASTVAEPRLGLWGDQPVWRLLAVKAEAKTEAKVDAQADVKADTRVDTSPSPAKPHWQTVDARSGALLPSLSDAQAAAVAEAFSGRHALQTERLERDQWTVPQGLDPHRPLVKVALDGDDGLELYVSPGAAEVVRDTRRAERFWNWVGAVPHWIYPTVLRQFPKAWHQVVVWLSIPGVLLAATGIALGIWQLFLNRRRWIPYRKFWMRWHHIAGLVGAVFTLTWMFSGLLSMNPFEVFSPRGASPAERAQWRGEPVPARLNPAQALALAHTAMPGLAPRELDLLQAAGQSWYRLRGVEGQALVRADVGAPASGQSAVGSEVLQALPDVTIASTLAKLRSADAAAGAPTLRRIDAYDELYYSRDAASPNTRHTRPLPVWRADWADGVTAYADAASARVLLRADASGRWQRVLYNGLHSFDFAPLMARPWLRDALVLGFSLLGTALCITSCVIAWRVLVPRRRRHR